NLVILRDGDDVEIGEIRLRSVHTPGHTPGSQSFLVTDGVVSGDTLFVGSCGRVDLPGSNPGDIYESLQKLVRLPGDTVLFPGHNTAPFDWLTRASSAWLTSSVFTKYRGSTSRIPSLWFNRMGACARRSRPTSTFPISGCTLS